MELHDDGFATWTSAVKLTFLYEFDLAGVDITTAALSGLWWASDNVGGLGPTIFGPIVLTFNGTVLDSKPAVLDAASRPFAVPQALFLPGANTLAIAFDLLSGSPGEFLYDVVRVEGALTAQSTSVPEPSTSLIFATAFAMFRFFSFRRARLASSFKPLAWRALRFHRPTAGERCS